MTDDEATKNEEHRLKMQELQKQHREEVRKRRDKHGLLLVHTGNGKGKSTAAFGLAIRAAGNGMKVAVVQFTKGSWKTGEAEAFKRFPEIEHFIVGDGFTWDTQNRQQDIASARRGWEICKDILERCRGEHPAYQLVILDELNIVVGYDYLPSDEIVETLRSRPDNVHVCVTGRGAKPELVAIADTVTEMTPIKHAYEAGVKAQRGIEF